MADFNKYFPTLIEHEGGYSDRSTDRGGPTNLGVTLSTWITNGYDKDGDRDIDKEDLKKITQKDAQNIAKKLYWDKVRGDDILSQSIAEFVFDFAYNSGVGTASKKLQEAIGVIVDGIVGKTTVQKLNLLDARKVFDILKAKRMAFVQAIVNSDPSQKANLKGWTNRINSFKFKS